MAVSSDHLDSARPSLRHLPSASQVEMLLTQPSKPKPSKAKCLPGTTQLMPSPGGRAMGQGHGLSSEYHRAICNTFTNLWKQPREAGGVQDCRRMVRYLVTWGQRKGPSWIEGCSPSPPTNKPTFYPMQWIAQAPHIWVCSVRVAGLSGPVYQHLQHPKSCSGCSSPPQPQ